MEASSPTQPPVAVSVALATFNGAVHLPAQLASLAAQTSPPLELVVSDDGSTDATLELVAEFARTAPFPVHINAACARLGYKANFMRAVSLCRGEVAAFCDQDDVWRPDKIGAVAAAFDRRNVTMVFHRAALIDGAGAPLGSLRQESGAMRFASLRAHSPFRYPLGFSMAVRRSLDRFSDLREASVDFYKPDEAMAHDQWFSSLAFMLGEVVYLDEELVAYRQHGGNLFGVDEGVLTQTRRRSFAHWTAAETDYRPLASTLDALAACAARIEPRLAPGAEGEGARAHLAIARVELARLSALYGLRARAYSAPAFGVRFMAWLGLLRAKAYARGAWWRFHRKFLLVDLLAGVMAASLAGAAPDRLYGDRTLETPDAPAESVASSV